MKKSHPIRRVMLATAATVSGIVLLLSLKPSSDPAAAAAGAAPQQTAAGQESPQGGSTQQTGAQTVTGDVVKTQYGPVQVQLTMSGGRITKADTVQAPKGGTSDQKTALAVPKLNEEAVAAQSADIDAVSGATYTSGGYKQSLQSALDKAKAAGGTSGSSGAAGASSSPQAPAAQARTVTGNVAQTQYGPVQVRLTLTGDKITKAEAVQAPSGGTSTQKTALAVPKLNQEAVAAGSADIDAVSGATYTSGGYKQSLQSALDKAGG
ncbi:FMN-binding protein [Streptomyces sp. NBC_00996]|uniref:FMN-binding protein n=1 Tax=Streptomyces sp. NBC_00996 TaxID=2903710 RepID=UPI003864CD07|nr:FMN-binding protein [Streptomyces sp. NBC_00996]